MRTKAETLRMLEELKGEIRRRYKVKEIGVFGSVIRGKQKEASDIDVLVDFEDGADLFDLTGLASFLEEKLDQKVDVVPKRVLREEIKEAVLREVTYL